MAAGDLCTQAEVNAFLQTPAGDTEQNPIIDALIARASRAISRYCNREFAPPTAATTTRRFEVDVSQPWLDLAPYDLRALVAPAVTIDPEKTGGGTVLTEHEDYRLWPRPNPDGVFTAIRFVYLPPAVRDGGMWRLVDVKGDWGFAAVPDDVKHWAILTVAIWLRRDVSAFSTTFNLDEERLERPEALPSAVRAGLGSWLRQTAV